MTTTGIGASTTFGERLKQARQTCGISLEEAAYQLRDRAPKQWRVSFGALAQWERGAVPEDRVDPWTLAVLADIYDVDLEELSPIAARDAAVIVKYAPGDSNPEPSDSRPPTPRREHPDQEVDAA